MPAAVIRDLYRKLTGASPLDWNVPSGRRTAPHVDGAPGPVDVVVPIYQAPEAFARCLESLRVHLDLAQHGLILVVDGPQPEATERRLALVEGNAGVTILRNPERRGFVASVNHAMAASTRDVVLLNADTVVTAGWLEKLRAAAYSAPEIATATPFSNTATICSLPRFLDANFLPRGETIESFARRIEQNSQRVYPRLPTGVGVCLFIKRRALQELGLFDEAAFGLGYGEESEFCQRALKAGWVHGLDDATFIYHEGHRSFGTERKRLVRGAHRRLKALHPEYLATIARFVQEDPLAPIRERALRGLLTEPTTKDRRGFKVVHVVHGWPPSAHGGTELYAAWLVAEQARHRDVAVYTRIADPSRSEGEAIEQLGVGDGDSQTTRNVRVRHVVRNFTERDPLARNALHHRAIERDFARFLAQERPALIHLHHLAGHSMGLAHVARAFGVPVVLQVQDWWLACARSNLMNAERELCPGPSLDRCSRCLPLTRRFGHTVWNRALHAVRRRQGRKVIELADARIAGSTFLAESWRQLGLKKLEIDVLPYGVPLAEKRPSPRARRGGPLRMGFLGSLLPHKGLHLAAAAFARVDPARAILDVWGDPTLDPEYTAEAQRVAGAALVLRGEFAEEDKAEILANFDVLLFPSLGLESFGLAAYEAKAAGVPVIASDRGALSELPRECGARFNPERPEELRLLVAGVIEKPETLEEWRRNLPRVRGFAEHAEAIEAVYARVLDRAASGRLG